MMLWGNCKVKEKNKEGKKEEIDEADDLNLAQPFAYIVLDLEYVNPTRSLDSLVSMSSVLVLDRKIISTMPPEAQGKPSHDLTSDVPSEQLYHFHTLIRPADLIFWNPFCVSQHQICQEQVRSSPSVRDALVQWVAWLYRAAALAAGRIGSEDIHLCLVAHNGVSCDFDWLFHLTHRHNISLPPNCVAYWDTLHSISRRPTHQFFQKAGNDLFNLHRRIFGEAPTGMHCSLHDCLALARILGNETFWQFRVSESNAPGIMPLSALWKGKREKKMKIA